MKIGFCMLLWTTSVDERHRPLLQDIKATGYDGVEVPVFSGMPEDYAALGRLLDDIGLERTAITVIPSAEANPLSDDPVHRRGGIDYLNWAVDCTAALGASQIGGPLHQTLGHFSGAGPTEVERERAREVHRAVGAHAASAGVTLALEAVNRFESYFVNTMDDLHAYAASVGHPNIRIMYDTFHANIEEADPIAALTRTADLLAHVHISENDRGVPGRGHVPWAATYKALRQAGYDGWLTIEAFSRGLEELAAAARVWRDFAENTEIVYKEGYQNIRRGWDAAA